MKSNLFQNPVILSRRGGNQEETLISLKDYRAEITVFRTLIIHNIYFLQYLYEHKITTSTSSEKTNKKSNLMLVNR